jgi:hypothetical protein
VIVGYSFPKTDALARKSILDAIDRDIRQKEVPVRQAHLVLGPDVDVPKNRRVLELMRHRMGHGRIVKIDEPGQPSPGAVLNRHRLWAEDFLGDYSARTRENMPQS